MGGNAALGRVSCKYSIKIPDFGMGTDTYNANGEEGQINLAAGSNTVCTFKVDSLDETTVKLTVNGLQKTFLLNESGYVDVLFACWMSADCHSNYLRIRFSETENSSTESGTQTENSDIVVPNESQAIASDRDTFATTPTPAETKKSTGGKVTVTTAYNHVGDGYYPYTGDDLWGSPVTIRAGVGDTVSWIVTVPSGTDVFGGMGGKASLGRVACNYSIKIPDFGMGTKDYNANGEAGQVNLAAGSNTVFTFKVDSMDSNGNVKLTVNGTQKSFKLNDNGYIDVLFACWMGADCHSNHIRIYITEHSDATNSPKTGESDSLWLWITWIFLFAGGIAAVKWYKNET